MAGRIRTLKPEILENRRTAALSSDAFRLFIGMILLADDHGNLYGELGKLQGEIFWACPPSQQLASLLTELGAADLVQAYEVRGQRYVHLRGWYEHQRVSHRGQPRVPPPPGSGDPPETLRRHTGESPETLRPDHGRGTDPDPKERGSVREEGAGELPAYIPPALWASFCDHRRRLRATMTPQAEKLLLAKIERFRTEGLDPIELLNTAMERGWRSVFAPSGIPGRQDDGPPPAYEGSVSEQVRAMEAKERRRNGA